jgi:hypothetical protein
MFNYKTANNYIKLMGKHRNFENRSLNANPKFSPQPLVFLDLFYSNFQP